MDALLSQFDESYLKTLRKSDFEIISEMIVRDINLARILPQDQRIALADLLRDGADLMEG
jgi:hypothetical protein